MLHCTTDAAAAIGDATPGYPVDHVALYQQARAMRSACVAALFARLAAALRRTVRQNDRPRRFIWP